jgi:hypothetical protein
MGLIGCDEPIRQRSAASPISTIQSDGSGEVFVELDPGIAARDIVDPQLFAPLRPGITPEEAARTIGPPASTETGENVEIFYYRAPRGRVAIARRHIAGSGTQNRTTAYEVRAYPGDGYAKRLPIALQDLLAKEPRLFRIILVSDVFDDWHVRLMIRDRHVECVVAFPKATSWPSGLG